MVFAPLCDSIPAGSGGGGGEKKVQPPLNFKAPLLLLLQFTEAASLESALKRKPCSSITHGRAQEKKRN